jgi:NADH-quinone oxidoreductase subunit M
MTYIIWLYYRVVMGEMNPDLVGLKLELSAREVTTLAPLALLALCLGLYPEYVLSYLRASVAQLLAGGVTP